jgi:hypothetical protein
MVKIQAVEVEVEVEVEVDVTDAMAKMVVLV